MRRLPYLTNTLLFGIVALLLGGCAGGESHISVEVPLQATPTLSPLFQLQPTPTVEPARPVVEPTAQPSRSKVSLDEQINAVPIFDDQLSPNWSMDGSEKMVIDSAYAGYAKNGLVSVASTPLRGEAQLQFSVKPDSPVRYRRDNVLGIRFWLSGGKNYIETEDLLVSVLGSNAIPYWVVDDHSVKLEGRVTDDSPVFSETRLYYLDINKAIPPETWVEVTLWLDERQFDPLYTYVTGLYIKNDKNFHNTFYVDNVRLLLQK